MKKIIYRRTFKYPFNLVHFTYYRSHFILSSVKFLVVITWLDTFSYQNQRKEYSATDSENV